MKLSTIRKGVNNLVNVKLDSDFTKTKKFFNEMIAKAEYGIDLHKYGKEGVAALSSATPKDSGETANSWTYKIIKTHQGKKIEFYNSHIVDNVSIAIILQYGHATRNGGWVEGRDYINPAVQPIFDKIAESAWKEVAKV